LRVELARIVQSGTTPVSRLGFSTSMIQNSVDASDPSVQLYTVPEDPPAVVRLYPVTATVNPENAAGVRVSGNVAVTSIRSIFPSWSRSRVPLKTTALVFFQPGQCSGAGAVSVTFGGNGTS
jgi:hypothetical protein